MTPIDPWLRQHLVCPIDQSALTDQGGSLVCRQRHDFPVEDGVPVMLREDQPQTIAFIDASIARARRRTAGDSRAPHLYLESLGISDEEKSGVVSFSTRQPAIDPVVAYLVAATNGLMYRDQIGVLDHYPIPELRLPDGDGRTLLDVGCSWGRWSVAAARRGYRVVGIDPSLGVVMAARRVANDLKVDATFVVGDARFLPFAADTFDTAFSYSVIQHFSKADARRAINEVARVLRPRGIAKVQMPSMFGVRCLYHQARRGFHEGREFDVRYWSLPELRRAFSDHLGSVRFEVEGFFGIGMQPSDRDLMSPMRRVVLSASEALRRASRVIRPLVWGADSIYVEAVKPS